MRDNAFFSFSYFPSASRSSNEYIIELAARIWIAFQFESFLVNLGSQGKILLLLPHFFIYQMMERFYYFSPF